VEGAVRAWSMVAGFAGPGKPLTNGLHLSVRESPAQGTFGVLTRAGGTDEPGGMPFDTPRLSASIWGPNKAATAAAAVAYANALRGLAASPVTVTTAGGQQIRLNMAGEVTVVESPDRDRPRYVVDARVWASTTT
jgi:hypothetical protein